MTRKFKLHPPRRAAIVSSNVPAMSQNPTIQRGSNYLRINMILNPSFTLPSDMPSKLTLTDATRIEEYEDTRAIGTRQAELPSLLNLPERAQGRNSVTTDTNQQSIEPLIEFPAHEYADVMGQLSLPERKELQIVFEEFNVVPRGRPGDKLIRDTTEWVPYCKAKSPMTLRGFHKRTIAWDKHYGLIRLSACFKATSSKKTDPKKAYAATDNLLPLCFNFTGGITERQGYWVPFDCARALCLKFCYPIRWLLVPVFGYKFIDECLREDDPEFGDFQIDQAIVAHATKEAKKYLKTDAQLKAEAVSGTRADAQSAAKTRNGRAVVTKADAKVGEHVSPTRISAQNRGVHGRMVAARVQKESQYQPRGARGLTGASKAQEAQAAPPTSRVTSPSTPDLAEADDSTYASSQTMELTDFSPRLRSSELATPPRWTSINQMDRIPGRSRHSTALRQKQPAGTSPSGSHPRGFTHSSTATSTVRADSNSSGRCNFTYSVRNSKHDRYGEDDSPSHSESDDEDIIIPNKRQRTHPTPVAAARSPLSGLSYSNEDKEGAEILLTLVGEKLNEH
nr:transcriptional repressor xbp1 [Quercus suber]